jgi:phosphoribosylformylglycinamidine synthase subunit PurQ / glutaminase
MKFGIVTFPGSNCDYDTFQAVVETIGEEAVMLWHKDHDLQCSDVVILPGGFSYGVYLRPGAIARFSPIMQEVVQHAGRGGPVIGICNGFQIACEAGLLPGALLRNASLKFVCAPIHLRVESTDSLFTSRYERGQTIVLPIAHGDGRTDATAPMRRRSIGSRAKARSCSATRQAPSRQRKRTIRTARCATSRVS